ncbi:hypothetical protein ACG04Q_11915 [Roseateles sp. DXS20W]|uniref:Uncharacterized protein n=1 Tax=Pelomonas lactea TaxID=3299030 RepID=A0ABW7GJZ3_9BURK
MKRRHVTPTRTLRGRLRHFAASVAMRPATLLLVGLVSAAIAIAWGQP